jgi:hypothetical protein
MPLRLTPHFLLSAPRWGRCVASVLLLVGATACTSPPPPEGGVAPTFAEVPLRPAPLLSPTEREAVIGNLEVDRSTTATARGVVEARLGRIEAAPAAVPLPAAPPTVAAPGPPPAPPPPPLVGNAFVTADGLVSLANAARRDRLFLQERLALGAPPPPPSDAPRTVTAIVFAPDDAAVPPLERARLANAVAAAGMDGAWTVAASGDPSLADARAANVRALLVEAGVPADRIGVVAGERQVDLAEVRVRR